MEEEEGKRARKRQEGAGGRGSRGDGRDEAGNMGRESEQEGEGVGAIDNEV